MLHVISVAYCKSAYRNERVQRILLLGDSWQLDPTSHWLDVEPFAVACLLFYLKYGTSLFLSLPGLRAAA